MADKGIRPAANAKFMEMLPQRAALGNLVFRKTIMAYLMEEFSCTNPAAATHYNHSFQECKKSNPELVIGLGRPEGKNNGGRKKKPVLPEAAAAPIGEETVAAGEAAVEGAPAEEAAAVEGAPVVEVVEEPAAVALVEEAPAEVALFNVTKVKDGTLVLLGVTKAVAEEAVAKAKAAKKAALQIV